MILGLNERCTLGFPTAMAKEKPNIYNCEPKMRPTCVVNTCKTLQVVFLWFMTHYKNIKRVKLEENYV